MWKNTFHFYFFFVNILFILYAHITCSLGERYILQSDVVMLYAPYARYFVSFWWSIVTIHATTIRIWLQSTNTCPQMVVAAMAMHQIVNIPAYGNAQYLRQCHKIAGNGLKGIISQFQSVQQSSEKQIK